MGGRKATSPARKGDQCPCLGNYATLLAKHSNPSQITGLVYKQPNIKALDMVTLLTDGHCAPVLGGPRVALLSLCSSEARPIKLQQVTGGSNIEQRPDRDNACTR